ncbi:hypothetical protein [Helicobacter canis]|nr:hypothetical protein [Helicobacter canis]
MPQSCGATNLSARKITKSTNTTNPIALHFITEAELESRLCKA